MRPYSNFQEVFKERINSLRDNKSLIDRMFEITYAAKEGNAPDDILLGSSYDNLLEVEKTGFYHAGSTVIDGIGEIDVGISVSYTNDTGWQRYLLTATAVTLINEVHGSEWKYVKTPRIFGFLSDEQRSSRRGIAAVIESFGRIGEAPTHPELSKIICDNHMCFEKPGEEDVYAVDFNHLFESITCFK